MDAITAEERAKHVATFQTLQSDDGYVTGTCGCERSSAIH